ncbi:MAG: hypothetical protein FWF77_01150 [Defluviitaleaceae bacterium]|nr:hypothetical protein [Defluviitaleaceae bacterium]
MFKLEVIQSLKKVNVSKNAEKTKARVREVWAPLEREVREEILKLGDIKKVSIERAYKTGGVSARVLVAMAQVLNIDPRWFTGEVDVKSTFDGDVVRKYLNGLGYDIDKTAVGRRKASKPPKAAVTEAATEAAVTERKKPGPKPGSRAGAKSGRKAASFPTSDDGDMFNITRELSDFLSKDLKAKLDKIPEEDVMRLIQSLSVQASFSEDKKARLTLVKCLLLV